MQSPSPFAGNLTRSLRSKLVLDPRRDYQPTGTANRAPRK